MALYPGAPAAVTASAKTTRPKTAAPKPGAFDWTAFAKLINQPVDYTGLTRTANAQAAAQTASQVAGIQAQQNAILSAARQNAAQQNQAALASSRYLQGLNLGGAVAGDYANAAAAQRAAAQGYSGGLQSTVNDAAAAVQRNLAAAGSPQQAANQGAAAGNALYGLGGNLPAEQLGVVGPTVAAGLRALPVQTLGYGQQLAVGALGAGQQDARKLDPQIAQAHAEQATNAAAYLKTLADQARQAGNDRIANIFKVLGVQADQQAAQATAAWHADQLDISKQRADIAAQNAQNTTLYRQSYLTYLQNGASEREAHNKAMETVASQNAQTSRINALKPPSLQVIGSDATGRSYVNDKGQLVTLPGRLGKPVVSATVTSKTGITNSLVKDVSRNIADWKVGRPGTASQAEIKPLAYDEALTQALTLGPSTKAWQRKATELVNAQYGDPVKIARANALKVKAQGLGAVQQLTTAIDASRNGQLPFPVQYAIDAIARAYNLPLAALRPVVAELMQGNG